MYTANQMAINEGKALEYAFSRKGDAEKLVKDLRMLPYADVRKDVVTGMYTVNDVPCSSYAGVLAYILKRWW